MNYASLHNHTSYSNLKLIDSINKTEDLIDYGYDLGLAAIAITDHDCLGAHVQALEYFNKKYKDKPYKLILGNEIYISREGLTEENHQPGEKFYHCILLAKDAIGHEQLRELSTIAWRDHGYFRVIMRTPTYLSDIERVVGANPGHLICTTACLGSYPGVKFKWGEYDAIDGYLKKMVELFGEDFFIEIQPSNQEDQRLYNRYMVSTYWNKYNFTVATDSHYLNKDERRLHREFLNSKESDGNREVDEFYSAAYLMSAQEVFNYLSQDFREEKILTMFENSIKMANRCQNYSLLHDQIVPKIQYEWNSRDEEAFYKFSLLMEQYNFTSLDKYIGVGANEADKYLAYLIGEGFMKRIYKDKNTNYKEYFERLDEELYHINAISEARKQPLSDYFNTMNKIVDLIWTDGDSLIGPGRGSACGSLINYLLGITQLDPLRQELPLPFWRFMNESRPDLPDIDIDTESMRRERILLALKKYFNSINSEVINVCTVGTIKTKSAIRTAGRGLDIEDAVINYIVSLVPTERGVDWTLDECRYGTEEKPKISQFANQMNLYPALWTLAKRIEGLVTNLSVHASGVLIINGSLTKHNSAMKTSKGVVVTAWDLSDSEKMGALKYDLLTVAAIDKIRTCMNYLLEYKYMEWQGDLRSTYEHYLLPANLDYTTPEMWAKAYTGEIVELFQFDTITGGKAIRTIKPTSIAELATGNSVMRLMGDKESGGEQPLDIYTRNKNHIENWYQEMRMWGLNDKEVAVLEKYLKPVYGVAASQEVVMQLTMDPQIANFNIKEANKLRKGIAKKVPKIIEETRQMFYQKGIEAETRKEMLDYVWKRQIGMSLGYSFSDLHTVAYSTIALQQMNLAYYYPIIIWNCACLSVDANAVDDNDYTFIEELDDLWVSEEEPDDVEEEEETSKDKKKKKKNSKVNYDKIASALGHFKDKVTIKLPDINKARMGFIPDVEDNSIMFGLKGISRIGDDIINEIISNRPYNSIQDFLNKMVVDGKKLISKDRVVNLIKAGCFDAIEKSDRATVMERFINTLVPRKKTLNLRNMDKLIEYDLVPENLTFEKGVYLFTKEARKRRDKVNGYYNLDEIMVLWFRKWMKKEPPMLNGEYKINSLKWDAYYNTAMNPVRAWIKANLEELIEAFYKVESSIEFNKYATGDELKWELDSLNFYHSGHPLEKLSTPTPHSTLNELIDGEFDGYWNIKGNIVPKMVLRTIVGTVLVKNTQKKLFILSTPEGVIQVKAYKTQFAKYDKVIKGSDGEIIQDSFLKKGTHLLLTGILRDGIFIPKVYKDTGFEPIRRIVIDENRNFLYFEDKQ